MIKLRNSKDLIDRSPIVFQGLMFDAEWEFDAPCFVLSPFIRCGDGGNNGAIDRMIENLAIDLSCGRTHQHNPFDDETRLWPSVSVDWLRESFCAVVEDGVRRLFPNGIVDSEFSGFHVMGAKTVEVKFFLSDRGEVDFSYLSEKDHLK